MLAEYVYYASLHISHMVHQARAYHGFCSMKRLGVFLLPLDGMLVHCRVTPQHKLGLSNTYHYLV